jgi:hypothetical protein
MTCNEMTVKETVKIPSPKTEAARKTATAVTPYRQVRVRYNNERELVGIEKKVKG